ncbi:MAG: HprK-related kinase A [Burkholderiales bacterium]
MKVGDTSASEFARILASEGVAIRTGPFVFRVTSHLPSIAAPFQRLYRDFPLIEADLIDFHLMLRPTGGFARFTDRCEVTIDARRVLSVFKSPAALPHLEWALNWWIYRYAHQFLILHAAVAERDGAAILLCGPPGSGKSTLCAALVTRGWRLLSDEVALIHPDTLKISATARPISLKNESIEVIGRFTPGAVFGPRNAETHKGTVVHMAPPEESVQHIDAEARPRWILFPQYAPVAKTRLTPIPKARAFLRTANNAFNYQILGSQAFRALAATIDRCGCYELTYADLTEALRVIEGLRQDAHQA